jgi:glutamate dehydrogenase (NAD(P)+)
MNAVEETHYYFHKAARVMDVGVPIETLLATPLREIKVQVSIEMDSGEIRTFTGYRIQHDNSRGPMKGGLRYHPKLDGFECASMASLMTWKTAVANLPYGGAKGGITCDPAQLSIKELERLTRKYVDQVQDMIGPSRDILAPDLNTNPQVMAWIMDQYSRYHGHAPAVVTGKPLDLYGSKGREAATGRGLLYIAREILRDVHMPMKGTRFALQGFGNVGSHGASILSGMGARLLAVNDADGTIYNGDGIDVQALMAWVSDPKNLKKTVAGFPGAQRIEKKDLWDIPADILVPAALGGEITADIAERLKVKLIAEGANGPTTPEADRVLQKRGIDLIPDIIANAGGVTVSYYEWIQNKRMERWSESEVDQRLEKAMKRNYRIIRDISRNQPRKTDMHDSRPYCMGKQVDPRCAAMILALKRIEAHYLLEGFSQ